MSTCVDHRKRRDVERVLLRVATVAAMGDFSQSFVYGSIYNGTLPAVRVGRAVRVRAEVADQWLRGLAGGEQLGAR